MGQKNAQPWDSVRGVPREIGSRAWGINMRPLHPCFAWVVRVVAAAGLLISPLTVTASDVVALVPGNTVVQDVADDLLLVDCNILLPDHPCSLPPGAPLALPDWFDIKTAKITEVGRGRVDLSIALHAPVPAAPPVAFVSYFWQFQDGCLVPSPTDKDGIRVHWDGDMWVANWYVILSCDPRAIVQGDPVDFVFTEDGVMVRVSLSDLITRGGAPLDWYAGVRRLGFAHPVFTHTVPVDVAPDVVEFNPSPPPILIHLEDPATWEPH